MDVFRPRTAGLGWGIVALPMLAAVLVALGFVGYQELGGPLGVAVATGAGLVAVLPLAVLTAMLRRWFSIRIDGESLTVVGLLGISRVRLGWEDQVAVGLSSWRGARLLAVRPATPYKRSPKRALTWDTENKVLLIGSLDNWSAPRDEVLAALHRHAGAKWADHLEQHPRAGQAWGRIVETPDPD